MKHLNFDETFVIVWDDDVIIDLRREYPTFNGHIVYDFLDVVCLYYNDYYDHPLTGIGKNKYGYFEFWWSDSYVVYRHECDDVERYEIPEYLIRKISRKRIIKELISNFLFCRLVGTNCNFSKKKQRQRYNKYLARCYYDVCKPIIEYVFGKSS